MGKYTSDDNRSMQLNPNNERYYSSRGDDQDDGYSVGSSGGGGGGFLYKEEPPRHVTKEQEEELDQHYAGWINHRIRHRVYELFNWGNEDCWPTMEELERARVKIAEEMKEEEFKKWNDKTYFYRYDLALELPDHHLDIKEYKMRPLPWESWEEKEKARKKILEKLKKEHL
jgi:hypothetical protein